MVAVVFTKKGGTTANKNTTPLLIKTITRVVIKKITPLLQKFFAGVLTNCFCFFACDHVSYTLTKYSDFFHFGNMKNFSDFAKFDF